MQIKYFDNAATSYPKAEGTGEAMADYINNIGVNVNRGSYPAAAEASLTLLHLRQALCRMYNCERPELALLMPGATVAINTVLKGALEPGEHIIVSSMEHNAVMRPVTELEKAGVEVSIARCCGDGTLDPNEVTKLIKPNTKLVLTLHASNVCGAILPIGEIGKICHEHGIPYCVDAAQTAGMLEIDMEAEHISALAMPGHKGLLGPGGTGALLLKSDFAKALRPLITGGTGSRSDSYIQPEELPDKFEAGTMNIAGFYGLKKALDFVETARQSIFKHERNLTARFMEGLKENKHVRIPGPSADKRVGVVAVDFLNADNAEMAFALESQYQINTRCGLQCAPAAHKTLGTFPKGAVRFSFGHKNTVSEVDFALNAIERITEAL